jgi:hypothetical protein
MSYFAFRKVSKRTYQQAQFTLDDQQAALQIKRRPKVAKATTTPTPAATAQHTQQPLVIQGSDIVDDLVELNELCDIYEAEIRCATAKCNCTQQCTCGKSNKRKLSLVDNQLEDTQREKSRRLDTSSPQSTAQIFSSPKMSSRPTLCPIRVNLPVLSADHTLECPWYQLQEDSEFLLADDLDLLEDERCICSPVTSKLEDSAHLKETNPDHQFSVHRGHMRERCRSDSLAMWVEMNLGPL